MMTTTTTMTTTTATTATTAEPVRVKQLVVRLSRNFTGLRARVVIGSILLLVAAFAISVVALRQALLVRVDDDINTAMAHEIDELRLIADGVDPATEQPYGENAAAIMSAFLEGNVPAGGEAFYAFLDGQPYLSSFGAPSAVFSDDALLDRWTSATEVTRVEATTTDGELHSVAVPLLGDNGEVLATFVVATYPAVDLADVNQVVRTVMIVALPVLLVASMAAWSLAGRMLRPVRELTLAARATGASDLTRRIAVGGGDEIAELAHTFNGMLDRLDLAFRSQRAFLNDVAHELRTPITIVSGHVELLSDDPAERAETIALVTDELHRMGRYVADLLLVARAAQPDFLKPQLVDIGEILDAVLAKSAPLGERDWVRTTVPRPGTLLTTADGDRLTQALLALVTNAVENTEVGDRIELGADAQSVNSIAMIRVWVADGGSGIDPSAHDRIFNRFSREQSSTASRPEGTGLGLTIVDAIVRAHGGEIQLDSALGEGTRFCIVIPRHIGQEDLQ
jgi:two-component system, OmpR family, sensor kinase